MKTGAMKPVDYDRRQSKVYAAARAVPAKVIDGWMDVFARHAPSGRPLTVLDLGSGTGRFTPALAATFGEAVGVEPSDGMRAVAEAQSAAPGVRYLKGQAEAIPLPDASVDLVLMFLSYHHVRDRAAAAFEIARVLRPGGRLLIRNVFSDRLHDLHWHTWFPAALDIEMRLFPTTAEVADEFAPAGLSVLALEMHGEEVAASLAESAERLKLRGISTFEYLDEADIQAGFAALDAAVAANACPGPVILQSDLMVLGRL